MNNHTNSAMIVMIVTIAVRLPVFCQSAPSPPQCTPAGAPCSSPTSPISRG